MFKFSKKGDAYKLDEDYSVFLKFSQPEIISKYGSVTENGLLTLKGGWFWNGSNVVPDSSKCHRASCVHDYFCEYMNGNLKGKKWRSMRLSADKEYEYMLREDGMSRTRAKVRYLGLRSYANTMGWMK